MARLTLALLGRFRATAGSGAAVPIASKKARALLAYLALRPRQPQTRDHVASMLWAGVSRVQARQNLRQTLLALRRVLSRTRPPALVVDGATVALGPGVDVDVLRFERLAAQATPPALRRALALYQGNLLGDLHLDEDLFEEWLRGQRERLRGRAVEALERLATYPLGRKALDEALDAGRRLLVLDPAQEPVHRALMRLYVRAGRRADAVTQYQVCAGVLRRQLGVPPEASTTRLYRQITSSDAASRSPADRRTRTARPDLVPSGPAPLVGRADELARLRHALDEAWHGRGGLVIVSGEAGIGKSRLIEELIVRAEKQGGKVVVGRCFESEHVLPFAPWVGIFRTEALGPALRETAEGDARRRADLARLLPELAPGDAAGAVAGDDYLRIFDAVTAVVGKLSSRRPTVLVLEDLHWADGMSARLLSFLARRARAWPLLLVASVRDEELPDNPPARKVLAELDREAAATLVRLGPLAEAETLELVGHLQAAVRARTATEKLGQRVWRLSEGHPFMVVETVRALHAGLPPGADESLPLAERIRQVILRRLERLGARSRELVAVAAVIGREFEAPLLRRAAAVSEQRAVEGLEELVRHRVLHDQDDRLAFTHDRIREVAYARLLGSRRRLLHHAVARAIEATYADCLEAHWAALGHHYREAGAWAEAAAYLRRAAGAAAAQGAHHAAVAQLDQALAALSHLPEGCETLDRGVELRLELGTSLQSLGQFERSGRCFEDAERAAEALGDRERLGWATVHLSFDHWITGRPRAGCELAACARAIGERLDDAQLTAQATISLGAAQTLMGEYGRAIEQLEPLVACLPERAGHPRSPALYPAVVVRFWLTQACAGRGEFERGIGYGRDGVRIAEALDHPYSLSLACWGLGDLYGTMGRSADAIPLLERALALAQDWRLDILPPLLKSWLGAQYTRTGKVAEGLSLAREGLAMWRQGRGFYFAVFQLAAACVVAGRWDEARSAAREAVNLARARDARGNEAWALRLLGEIALRGEPLDAAAAEAHYRSALAIAIELGMRPALAHCHAGLGRLFQRTGRREQAEEHLATAATMFREMGMPVSPDLEASLRG
jgi:DNA-binding SARP family transcriptional activator